MKHDVVELLATIITIMMLFTFGSNLYASEIILVEIQEDGVVVRQTPSPNSSVVTSLTKGKQLLAMKTDRPDWIFILIDNKPGYIQHNKAKIIRTISEGKRKLHTESIETENCEEDPYNFSLTIGAIDFKCKESLLERGYDKCYANFTARVITECSESYEVNVKCEGELEYETKSDILTSRTTEYVSKTISVNYGSGSRFLEIDWSLHTIMDPVVKAKLNDLSCKINSVYKY